MSLIFNKYLSIDLPSSFMLQAVLSALSNDCCFVSDNKSIKDKNYIHIIDSFSFKERWIVNKPTLLLAKRDVSKYALFFIALERKTLVNTLHQVFKKIANSKTKGTVLVHMFIPFAATFDVIDFLDLLSPINLILIENAKISHISFVLKGNHDD